MKKEIFDNIEGNEGEITQALCEAISLQCPDFKPVHCIAHALYQEATRLGCDSNVLSVIGSWGDTLCSKDVLQLAKEYAKLD